MCPLAERNQVTLGRRIRVVAIEPANYGKQCGGLQLERNAAERISAAEEGAVW
jgi:hypothetical protein